MLQRIAACQQCRGVYAAYVMYTVQAAHRAVSTGDLWLSYGTAVHEASCARAIHLHEMMSCCMRA